MIYGTPLKTTPRQAKKRGLISPVVLSLFKTVMALIGLKTESDLQSEENVMHAIASTYTQLIRCECSLAAVPRPRKGTQHEGES